jgi:hypothetical protein
MHKKFQLAETTEGLSRDEIQRRLSLLNSVGFDFAPVLMAANARTIIHKKTPTRTKKATSKESPLFLDESTESEAEMYFSALDENTDSEPEEYFSTIDESTDSEPEVHSRGVKRKLAK